MYRELALDGEKLQNDESGDDALNSLSIGLFLYNN